MNKGIIYKSKVDFKSKKFHFCIRLENTVKIKDKNGKELEYNIFLSKTNNPAPDAKLVPIEEYFTCDFDLSAYLRKRLDFDIAIEKDGDTDEKLVIKSVEYYEA